MKRKKFDLKQACVCARSPRTSTIYYLNEEEDMEIIKLRPDLVIANYLCLILSVLCVLFFLSLPLVLFYPFESRTTNTKNKNATKIFSYICANTQTKQQSQFNNFINCFSSFFGLFINFYLNDAGEISMKR